MELDRRLAWLFNVVFALTLVLMGFLFFIVPLAPHLRHWIATQAATHWMFLSFTGVCIFLGGGLLLSTLLVRTDHSHYRIEGNLGGVMVDREVIGKYVDAYWSRIFPDTPIYSQVDIGDNKIEVTADLPGIPLVDQKPLLKKIERDLAEIFEETLGYRKEYILAISFASGSHG